MNNDVIVLKSQTFCFYNNACFFRKSNVPSVLRNFLLFLSPAPSSEFHLSKHASHAFIPGQIKVELAHILLESIQKEEPRASSTSSCPCRRNFSITPHQCRLLPKLASLQRISSVLSESEIHYPRLLRICMVSISFTLKRIVLMQHAG